MHITICICTRHRIDSLLETLDAISACEFDSHDVNILIVANENDGATEQALQTYSSKLQITTIESGGGLARARNAGLEHIQNNHSENSLVICLDDDVTPSKDCFRNLAVTAEEFGENYIYGGRIAPVLDQGGNIKLFDFLIRTRLSGPLFALYDPGTHTGLTTHIPHGPIYAYFLSSIGDVRFRENFGLGSNRPSLGEETEFLTRLMKKGLKIIYCKEAMVEHRIRKEQTSKNWLIKRVTHWARSDAKFLIKSTPKKLDEKLIRFRRRRLFNKIARYLFFASKNRHLRHLLRYKYYQVMLEEINHLYHNNNLT